MTSLRFSRATYALLALGFAFSPAATAQPSSGVSLDLVHIESPVLAGTDIDLTFTVTNDSPQPVARVVAVVTDPTGRVLSTRSLHGGTIEAGHSLTKSPKRSIPAQAIPGTYRVSIEALAEDGSTLASVPRQFDMLSTTRAFATPGLELTMPSASASVVAGDSFQAHIQLANGTTHTVDQIYAVAFDPNGRLMNARNIHAGDIPPSGALDKIFAKRIPEKALPGTYQVQLQCRSTEGFILSTSPFSFDVTAPVAGLRASEPLAAFPNPAATRTTLRFGLDQDAGATLAVYDALGRQVQEPLNGAVFAGRTDTELDVSGLAPGIYVARLVLQGGDAQVARFTVAH